MIQIAFLVGVLTGGGLVIVADLARYRPRSKPPLRLPRPVPLPRHLFRP